MFNVKVSCEVYWWQTNDSLVRFYGDCLVFESLARVRFYVSLLKGAVKVLDSVQKVKQMGSARK